MIAGTWILLFVTLIVVVGWHRADRLNAKLRRENRDLRVEHHHMESKLRYEIHSLENKVCSLEHELQILRSVRSPEVRGERRERR